MRDILAEPPPGAYEALRRTLTLEPVSRGSDQKLVNASSQQPMEVSSVKRKQGVALQRERRCNDRPVLRHAIDQRPVDHHRGRGAFDGGSYYLLEVPLGGLPELAEVARVSSKQ
jgi:hypothetical protein